MKQKRLITAVAVVLLLCSAVGGTLAWMTAKTNAVTNTFRPGNVEVNVVESFANGKKTNVYIENPQKANNIKAYIRAAVVINWADEDGNVSGTPVEADDYTANIGNDWTPIGDYYYYTKVVDVGEKTTNLIDSIAPAEGKAPDGYDLQVTILAEGIQYEPRDAMVDAWGENVANKILGSVEGGGEG